MSLRDKYLNDICFIEENKGDNSKAIRASYDLILRKIATIDDFSNNDLITSMYKKSEVTHLIASNNHYMKVYSFFKQHYNNSEINKHFELLEEVYENGKTIQTINCDAPMLTKSTVIKCVSETDQSNTEYFSQLIDKIWDNKYYSKMFSLLSIFIAEGVPYNFLFSENLSNQAFASHIEIADASFSTFVHEAYHAIQHFLTGEEEGYEFNNEIKIEFFKALHKTYLHIAKHLSQNDLTLDTNLPLESLRELIHKILPYKLELEFRGLETKSVVPGMPKDFSLPLALKTFLKQAISNNINLDNISTVEDLDIAVTLNCQSFEDKYQLPIALLERIAYFTMDTESSREVMPSIFQLRALDILYPAFNPMLDYFDSSVSISIDAYIDLHITYFCNPLLDEINQQCLPVQNYDIYSKCITDLFDI